MKAAGKQRIAVAVSVLLAGCAIGPDYHRPDVPAPEHFRGLGPETLTAEERSLGELGWWELFDDPVLAEYIERTLANNHQIAQAAARVEEFRAIAGIARSEFYPEINGDAGYQRVRITSVSSDDLLRPVGVRANTRDSFSASASLFYELDFWGRIRRLNEAARAELFATQFAKDSVTSTLVSSVAETYFSLRELDYELEIARRTRESRGSSLDLAKSRSEQGVTSKLDVFQADVLVRSADIAIVQIERQIKEQEHLLSVLLGEPPGDVRRGKPLLELELKQGIPAGLPSSLLERRPDIRQAEENLIAENARIGAAKALYFPQVSITGLFGYESPEFSQLFEGSSRRWNFGPAISFPIFTGFRISYDVEAAEARQKQALEGYKEAIIQAFREVSDALTAYQKTREVRTHQEALVESLRGVTNLSTDRYRGGISNYLEVLDAERQLFDAERALAGMRRDELLSVVFLYRALGGGWQEKVPPENQTAAKY